MSYSPAPQGPPIPELLRLAVQQQASDLHVAAGQPARFRVNGTLIDLDADERSDGERVSLLMPSGKELAALLQDDLTDKQVEEWHKSGSVDTLLLSPDGERFRCNYYWERGQAAAAFHPIPATPPSIRELGYPKVFKRIAGFQGGLVLFTGPSRSGKTTSAAAMLRHIYETQATHIVTIENPIEYIHQDARSLIDQREVGVDTVDVREGLIEVLHQDVNVILVGDMRGADAVTAALEAADAGHLVLSTFCAQDTAQSIGSMLWEVPSKERSQIRTLLATTLRAVIAQRLLPRRDGEGRVAALEVLLNTPAIGAQVREERFHEIHATIGSQRAVGMQTLERALTDLLAERVIDEGTAVRATHRLGELETLVKAHCPGNLGALRDVIRHLGV